MGNGMNAPIQSLHTLESASGYLTIDLAALRNNYKSLAALAPSAQMAAVVKADAYGLGAERIAPEFYMAGCRLFFVAHLQEAVSIKAILPSDAEIYVLNGLQPGTEQYCSSLGIRPVLNSIEQIQNWTANAGLAGKVAIQIDSGMSRLGLACGELQALQADPTILANLEISFIMSHLACADDDQHPQNRIQLDYFRQASALFVNVPHCFSNSGGLFLGDDFHHQIIRPGIALYGDAPTAQVSSPVQPVVRLDVAVIQTREVPADTLVGYSGTFIAPKAMRLATIAAGYADGLPRTLSNKGAAWFHGKKLPFVGRVSMDSIILDVTDLEANELKLGGLVEIIGENQSLEDLADAAGTISYEILTSLGRRYQRNYINASAPTFCPLSSK
jgi:alanine racemase